MNKKQRRRESLRFHWQDLMAGLLEGQRALPPIHPEL